MAIASAGKRGTFIANGCCWHISGNFSGGEMKPVAIVGIVLIVLGIAGLVLGRFSYTTEEKVLDVGPLEATAEKEHSVAIPDIAGIAAILAGGFLVFVGRRRT
ncbi:MAG TPA: hypothetical protein VJV39_20715 [Dongiaceae bacterium]|nr:hypothetical protein [Dongiaceae bacterium]